MARRSVLAGVLVVATACADDDGSSASGTSDGDSTQGQLHTTGESAPTSSVPSADAGSSGAIDSGDDPDDTGTSSTGTADPDVEGRAALIVLDDLDTPGVDELYRVDYVNGALTDPIRVSGPAGTNVVQPELSPNESMLVYRPFEAGAGSVEYAYALLDAGEAGPTGPVHQPPAPDDGLFAPPVVFADETMIAYYGAEDPASSGRLYIAEVTADGVQAPQIAVDPVAGAVAVISENENWLGFFRRVVEGDPLNGWIAPLSPIDLGGAVQVSDLDEPSQGILGELVFVPGDEALWYLADRDTDQVREIFFVDLSGAVPAAPVKVNDPLAPDETLQPVRLSPDRMQLAYFVGADLRGEIHAVRFADATVSAPDRLSTLGEQQAYPATITWSPDSRWLVYLAEHLQADALDVYAVDMTGAVPSEPMLVSTGGVVPESGPPSVFFDHGRGWMYVVASIDGELPEVYRSDLSGAMPGALQKVSADLPDGAWVPELVVPSHDANWALYYVEDGAASLWMVDVSGDEPGEAQLVHGPLERDEEISFFSRWSGDDSVIVYGTQSGASTPGPYYLVERDALTDPILVSDQPERLIVMDFVPR